MTTAGAGLRSRRRNDHLEPLLQGGNGDPLRLSRRAANVLARIGYARSHTSKTRTRSSSVKISMSRIWMVRQRCRSTCLQSPQPALTPSLENSLNDAAWPSCAPQIGRFRRTAQPARWAHLTIARSLPVPKGCSGTASRRSDNEPGLRSGPRCSGGVDDENPKWCTAIIAVRCFESCHE